MKRNSILFLLTSLLLLTACGEQPHYQKVYSFEDRKWNLDVKPEFTVDIQDIEKEYDFELLLRTTTDYPYSNLWIFMKTTTPNGEVAREPFEIRVANEDGSWIGNKTGTIVETPINFKRRKLPEKGNYTFIIEQAITEYEVSEVLDLQFTVSAAEDK